MDHGIVTITKKNNMSIPTQARRSVPKHMKNRNHNHNHHHHHHHIYTLHDAQSSSSSLKRKSSSRLSLPKSQSSSLLIHNIHSSSTRTLWILTLLLLVTLLVQILLIAHHEEVLVQLDQFEEEAFEVLTAANTAAHEFQHQYFFSPLHSDDNNMADGKTLEEMIVQFSNYSMDPIDILQRAEVDHSLGYVPSISAREARGHTRKRIRNHPHRQKAHLPSLEEIQSLYGNRTHILGLDRCEEYRNTILPEHRLIGPAGLFNTATNLLVNLLRFNCINEARMNRKKIYTNFTNGILYQAPWGKHNPLSWRMHHETKSTMGLGEHQQDFLPIVMVKDPITWMASMCRHPYEARWPHTLEHCPNLVPNTKYDRWYHHRLGDGKSSSTTTKSIGLRVKFATRHFGNEPIPDPLNRTFVSYPSLVHLWNNWYQEWYSDANFPRVMVRFEDLLFHAEETISRICHCWGGSMRKKFQYVKNSAKGQMGPHAGSAGFLASLVTYGNSTLRNSGILTKEGDVLFARENLDEDLMSAFGYAMI